MSGPRTLRFDVFGRRIAVVEEGRGWQAFILGAEGKRRPAGIAIPPGLDEAAIATWLGDVFHESASPRHPDVRRLD